MEIYDSPLGEFYVDPETADDAVDTDPLDEGLPVVPGVGEVEYVVVDFGVDDLSEQAVDEFEDAGVDVGKLFLSKGALQLSARGAVPVLPDADLIREAGACDVALGENVIERLEECAAAGEVDAPVDVTESDSPESDAPGGDIGTRAVVASPPSGCASARSVKYISRTK